MAGKSWFVEAAQWLESRNLYLTQCLTSETLEG
jgi:hypothetical protein